MEMTCSVSWENPLLDWTIINKLKLKLWLTTFIPVHSFGLMMPSGVSKHVTVLWKQWHYFCNHRSCGDLVSVIITLSEGTQGNVFCQLFFSIWVSRFFFYYYFTVLVFYSVTICNKETLAIQQYKHYKHTN